MRQLEDEVEKDVRKKEVSEITSIAVGKMVLKRLKAIDRVAWLRFSTVYLEVSDIEEYEKLVEKLTN